MTRPPVSYVLWCLGGTALYLWFAPGAYEWSMQKAGQAGINRDIAWLALMALIFLIGWIVQRAETEDEGAPAEPKAAPGVRPDPTPPSRSPSRDRSGPTPP